MRPKRKFAKHAVLENRIELHHEVVHAPLSILREEAQRLFALLKLCGMSAKGGILKYEETGHAGIWFVLAQETDVPKAVELIRLAGFLEIRKEKEKKE